MYSLTLDRELRGDTKGSRQVNECQNNRVKLVGESMSPCTETYVAMLVLQHLTPP